MVGASNPMTAGGLDHGGRTGRPDVAMFATQTYGAADPNEYVSLIRGGRVELIVAQRGVFDASLTQVDLGKLWMQRGRESRPLTFRVVTAADRGFFYFLASPQPPVTVLSSSIEHSDLGLLTPGEALCVRSTTPCEWAAMSLPIEEYRRYGAILTGKEVPYDMQQVLRPLPSRLARLRRLHHATVELAETAPEVLRYPDAARGLQQHLIEAAFGTVADADNQVSVSGHRRQRVIARFEALIEANPDRALFLTEVCEAIGVTERTFRNCCHQDLGMTPTRYLLLRRLHQAHWTLRISDPASATVTEVATRYGFWGLSRFSMAYRDLFQESPSETLKKPSGKTLQEKKAPVTLKFSESV
jgi:AraC-like DNA-binding protein